MDKTTYLSAVEKALKGLSATDRQNALAYYSEYLDDAESEGHPDAEGILGSPRTLAAQIKADIAMNPFPPGYQSASGYQQAQGYQPASGYQPPMPPMPPMPARKEKSGIGTVWTVVLAIFAIPIGLPLALSLVVLALAVLLILFALLITLAAIVVAFFAGGLAAGIVGFILLFSNFPVGLFYLGAGLILLGLFILCAIAFWQLWRLCIKGVARLFNAIRMKLTERKRVAQ